MANDSKQYPEEEYIFPGENQIEKESEENFSTEMPEEEYLGKSSFLQEWRKNLVIGIIFLILVFVVYKIVHSFFSSSSEEKPATEVSAVQSRLATSKQQQAAAPASPLNEVTSLYKESHVENQRLSQLEMAAQGIQAEISDMKNTTQNLQSSVDSINAQMAQLNTTLTTLVTQMDAQEKRLMAAQKKKEPAVAMKKLTKKQVTFRVLAIIPGRAWLKASNGSTITIGQGTEVPGYGKVVMIDPKAGQVVTDSGKVIEYSPEDL